MEHHGLQSSSSEKKLMNKEMCKQIISDIASGCCADLPRFLQMTGSTFQSCHTEELTIVDTGCKDFVHDANLNKQANTEITFLHIVVNKISS